MSDSCELLRLYAKAKVWEEMTGLSGDCFRAVATWKKLKKVIPELDGPE